MHLDAGTAQSLRVPKLAPGCDPARLSLSPAEGFLLSRVDGKTPWSVLCEMGGLAPDEIDRLLGSWVEAGFLTLGEPPGASSRPAPASAALDPGLDLPLEAQERILAFEARLERPYHELLGVPRTADPKVVKRAYFELSKEFHPDRYFRRQIGHFADRLERVFARIAEAYELLSDPTTRAEVERGLEESVRTSAPEVSGLAESAQAARRARAALHPARLRELSLRKAKAKSFFESGMTALKAGRWIEASASVRLAIAFDPGNQAYRESFGAVQRKASEERGALLLRQAERALEVRDHREALRLLEEALHHRPHDPQANFEAARLVLLLGEDPKRAKEYAARACEIVPENAAYRRLLGQVYRSAGLVANARRELEAALRIDPKDASIKAELRALG